MLFILWKLVSPGAELFKHEMSRLLLGDPVLLLRRLSSIEIVRSWVIHFANWSFKISSFRDPVLIVLRETHWENSLKFLPEKLYELLANTTSLMYSTPRCYPEFREVRLICGQSQDKIQTFSGQWNVFLFFPISALIFRRGASVMKKRGGHDFFLQRPLANLRALRPVALANARNMNDLEGKPRLFWEVGDKNLSRSHLFFPFAIHFLQLFRYFSASDGFPTSSSSLILSVVGNQFL